MINIGPAGKERRIREKYSNDIIEALKMSPLPGKGSTCDADVEATLKIMKNLREKLAVNREIMGTIEYATIIWEWNGTKTIGKRVVYKDGKLQSIEDPKLELK
jgi:hypothetical protein